MYEGNYKGGDNKHVYVIKYLYTDKSTFVCFFFFFYIYFLSYFFVHNAP